MAFRKQKNDPNLTMRGYVYRIYPNKEQTYRLNQNINAVRIVYNRALGNFYDLEKAAFENDEKYFFSLKDARNCIKAYKETEEGAWIKECDSVAIDDSLRNLEKAFSNIKTARKQIRQRGLPVKFNAGWPKFKKKGYGTSYNTSSAKIVDNRLSIPKIKGIKIILHRDLPENSVIKGCSIIKTPAGEYYASLKIEFPKAVIAKKGNDNEVGLDMGVKNFYTDSNGTVVARPTFLIKSEKRLARLERQYSHKLDTHDMRTDRSKSKRPKYDFEHISDMKNLEKLRKRIAKLNRHVAKQREYFLHQESRKLASENSLICLENISVAKMTQDVKKDLKGKKKRKTRKAMTDISWGTFTNMLKYKASEYNSDVIEIDKYFASSQLCSVCGFKNEAVKDLKVRSWECPKCGVKHNRDVNASINILVEGKRIKNAG